MESIMPNINFSTITPEIIIAATALIVLLLQAFAGSRGRNYFGYVTLLGVVAAFVMVFIKPAPFVYKSVETAFNGLWVVDNYSRFFKLIFLLGTGLTVMISIRYVEDERMQYGEYFALLLFATLGMMVMAGGTELMTLFIGLELMSISLYALAGFTRSRLSSNEAAMKYFLLGSFATGFLLYGMALLYGASGTTNLQGISRFIISNHVKTPMPIVGMALLIVGFGFKIAAVPFHMWAPDVYQGAPSPVTAFMSAGPKAAAFAAFVRIFMDALPGLHDEWIIMIWILAALTMTIGNVIALVQDNIKRMLAYSSIAHAGYVLVAFLSAGEMGISSIMYYMLAYTLMNIGAFAIITVLGGAGEERVFVSDYNGLGYTHPMTALAMSLFLFSLAGIPPTAGFMGKFYIFSAAIKQGYVGLAIIGVINSVVSVYYYLRITVAMYMKPAETADDQTISRLVFSPACILAILISAIGVLRLGVFPADYIDIARQSLIAMQ